MPGHHFTALLLSFSLVGQLCPAAIGAGAEPLMPAPPVVASQASEDPPRVEAMVMRVIDGNSLDAHVSGNRTAVGYVGVETPAANQPCGREALARNRELVGARVLLEEDPGYQFDQAGRRLYHTYTLEGQLVDEVLVREGLAWAVRTDARHGAYLAALQAETEATGVGCLWGGASG